MAATAVKTLTDRTLARVLDVAELQLDYVEHPAGSNRTKYGRFIGMDGQPWCLAFTIWCFHKAGFNLYRETGSCTAFVNQYRKVSPSQIVTKDYKPGDIVFFDFSGNKRKTEHVGIVKAVSATGKTIITIEGNTGTGDNTNGGAVMERSRSVQLVTCAVRPKYPE